LHVLGRNFERRRRWKTLFALLREALSALQALKMLSKTVFVNRKQCLHVLGQYFEHRRRWKTLFALLGEAFSALQALKMPPFNRLRHSQTFFARVGQHFGPFV